MNRAKIEDVLLAMGVPAGIKGFNYIADAVEYIDEHGTDISATKELYPDIAKIRNTTASRVERAIRHAFSFYYDVKGDYETIEKYIGFMNQTNFSSLVRLHMKIKQECGENSQEETNNRVEGKESVAEPNVSITALEIREIFRQELKIALNELKGSCNMNFPKPQIDRDTAMELWINERSEYAKEQLVLNNVGMVGLILKQLNLNPFDEDLVAISLVGVIKAVNTFNPDKGVKFTAYATPIIRNEILMSFRKKRIIPSFSLDEPCVLGNGEEVSYSDMIADGRRFEEEVVADMQVKQMIDSLNGKEKQIVFLRKEGKTQYEIAEICGLSQGAISKIIAKCKRKFMED